MPQIEVTDLCKEFRTYQRPKGFVPNLKALFRRTYSTKTAVDHINLSIEPGELVGYIGANGAGKSTTIKMLTGILAPTSGSVLVSGKTPSGNRRENAMRIGVVFGQRSQLNWDLPMEDTFELYKRMYRVPDDRYRRNVDRYVELLEMGDFLRKPVRQLSLGQKMRAELAISLLHDPEILYLDEPTIGLDVLVKDNIRHFVRQLNRERGTTVLLTTHDMQDIDRICDRIIMIDGGRIIHDSPLSDFKQRYSQRYNITVDFAQPFDLSELSDRRLRVEDAANPLKVRFSVDRDEMPVGEMLTLLSATLPIKDVSISQPTVEEIVREIYRQKD